MGQLTGTVWVLALPVPGVTAHTVLILGIFPDYVAGFNELLKPEYRYETLAPDELNMELRIFALIKMGEKDSSTISKLLHCSIKTVYNKRSDIKKKLIGPSSEFEKKLAQL